MKTLNKSFNTVATVYTDGLAEPNPGLATFAFAVYHHDQLTYIDKGVLPGKSSNNRAEYWAFGKGLRFIADTYKRNDQITLRSDSKLVLNQISGEYACNVDELRRLRDRCRELITQIKTRGIELRMEWVASAENRADEYTRIAYTEATGKQPKNWKKGVAK